MCRRCFLLLLFIIAVMVAPAQVIPLKGVVSVLPVAEVWSGHPVGFAIHTTEKFQYVCYYDTARNMVIAQRPLPSNKWKRKVLPTVLGWDSHNYVTMAIDKNGFIHVSGNMHNVPMIYFRSARPEDISAFEPLPMTSRNEERATYPVFFKDHQGELYFQYRNGGSGQGITYWNRYDAASKQWRGLFDTPFFDGEGEANAYMTDPRPGPDDYFYVVWMWRLTPVANTNHNLACARSKDLIHWENMRGTAVSLPIKWRDNLPVVDPVGPWNGLINMSFRINWNADKVPYISYHKFDERGVSQLYLARFEQGEGSAGKWVSYQVSNWQDFTWPLNLGGSLKNSVAITHVSIAGKNELAVGYMHEKHGSGTWIVDENTMKVKEQRPTIAAVELPVMPLQNNMVEQRRTDNTGRFILRWQTLATNQDRPRPGPHPSPASLVVVELK